MGERRRGFDDVLAVVQNQQQLPLANRGNDPIRRFRVRCVAEQRIPQTESGERGVRHVIVRADGCEFHQPDPVRQVAEQCVRGFGGQPGFPRATRPDQGGQSMFGDEIADRGDVSILADEAGQLGTQVGFAVLLRPPELASQQRDMQRGQLG
jgi:hypothetical protein